MLPNIVRLLVREGEMRRQRRLEESDKDRESRRTGPEPGGPQDAPEAGKTSAKQVEVPRCATCKTAREVSRCPGCEQSYCALCVRDHFANNPGHDRT